MTDDQRDKIRQAIAVHSGARWLSNVLKFGIYAPRPNQHLTLSPERITHRYAPSLNDSVTFGNRFTGTILDGDWDQKTGLVSATPKAIACKKHFIDAVSWEKTGIFDRLEKRISVSGSVDDCTTPQDIRNRYSRLDQLWDLTTAAGRLPPDADINTHASDGILVHIDRHGTPIFGNQGFHRLSICQLAEVSNITCVIGLVHSEAVTSGAYKVLLNS